VGPPRICVRKGILNWTNLHDIDLSRWPNLKAYVGRVAAQPKVQEAMGAEGLLK
jgi:glutathione S-transferase